MRCKWYRGREIWRRRAYSSERKTPVNLWLINSSFILDFYAVIPGFIHLKSQRQKCLTRSHITQAFIQVPLTFTRSKIKILRHSFRFFSSCKLAFSSFDLVGHLGANVNNARTRIYLVRASFVAPCREVANASLKMAWFDRTADVHDTKRRLRGYD